MIRTVSAVMALTLMAAPAVAADISASVAGASGAVIVSRAGALQSPMGPASILRQGDRVIAKGGIAKISFSDGCKVTLKAGSMLTVGKSSPCARGGLTKVQGEETVSLPIFGTVGTTTAIVGGVVVVGGVLGITAAAGGFDDSSTSP